MTKNPDSLTTHEHHLVTDILFTLDSTEIDKALPLLSIPALRLLLTQSGQITTHHHCLRRAALQRLEELEG